MKPVSIVFSILVLVAFTSSAMAQIDWKKYEANPVIVPGSGAEFDDLSIFPACVIFHDSSYHMWYGGHNGARVTIGYATSPDGISWTKYAGNPVLNIEITGSWEDESVQTPYVLFYDNMFHMWYAGNDGTHSRIGYATSSDGIQWTKYAGNPIMDKGPAGSWESLGIWPDCIYYDGNKHHMWYGGDNGVSSSIGYATSTDGITWTRDENNPVLSGDAGKWDQAYVGAPHVTFDGNTYHMWYTGNDSYLRWQWDGVGYATSDDGVTWSKYKNNPVLAPEEGMWDNQYAGFARVLWDSVNAQFKMWYGGGCTDWYAKIGYATAPDILDVPAQFTSIQTALDQSTDGDLVLVEEGNYFENIKFKGKAITVASQFYIDGDTSHISKTIIDGSQPGHPDSGSVVYFDSGEDTSSVLYGFTITGGTGTNLLYEDFNYRAGGGILINFSGAKVLHNRIVHNTIDDIAMYCYGGGIQAYSGENLPIIIRDNVIAANTVYADWGGGGGAELGGWAKIIFERNKVQHNLFSGVRHGHGGGILLLGALNAYNSKMELLHNTVLNNTVLASSTNKFGGGVYSEACHLLMVGNVIARNSAYQGGGLCILTLESFEDTSRAILINNTIALNEGSAAGGIWNRESQLTILNSIIWGNMGAAQIGGQNIQSLEVFFSNIEGGWPSGVANMAIDPLFEHVSQQTNDTIYCCLSGNSPCIDMGPDTSFFYDQESIAMPYTAQWPAMGALRNDLGAYGGKRNYDVENLPDIIDWLSHVKEIHNQLPVVYSLKQNYPNPFNPITTITFYLPKSEFVKLTVCDVLGKIVTTLVANKLNPGEYNYTFNAGDLASGIYYYQLHAGDYHDVKKMILLK